MTEQLGIGLTFFDFLWSGHGAGGYSEDFLTWWENRPGRGRPKKGNAVSALAYMVPPTPNPVPILAMATKPRKKVRRRAAAADRQQGPNSHAFML